MTAQLLAFVVMPALMVAIAVAGYTIIVLTDPARKKQPAAIGDLFDHRHA